MDPFEKWFMNQSFKQGTPKDEMRAPFYAGLAASSKKQSDQIKLVVGECPWCSGAIVLFNGSSCGPCPHCKVLYGIAKNQRPAGELITEWLLTRS